MLQVEERLQRNFPHWFRGRRARIARPLLRTAGRWSRLDAVDAFLAGHGHLDGFAFVSAALAHLGVRYRIDDADLERIPAQGALLVVANHPSGALDAPVLPELVAEAIAGTELLGSTADRMQIRLASCAPGSPLLREIGRLRELTFRRVGEGTGRRLDLDAYDAHYQHIVVWDAAAQRIAGAYRIARGARVLAARGLDGLYTASLFRYEDAAIPRIAEGLELGRSFVTPEYWGSRSLDYLWQGIGAYLRRYPGVRYLFGAVSISAALPLQAREQLVAYYQRYYGAGDTFARHANPFEYFAAPPCFGDLDAQTAFG